MFYGWIVVGVAFVTQFVSTGFIFYTFGIALKDFTVEFESGRLGVSGVHFVMPWAGAVIAPVVGRLAGAGHLRPLITGGAVAAGLGFCAISQARELWQLYVIYPVLMAFAAATLSGVGASTLVVNWFARARGTALGVSQIGASAGGMVMAPLTVSLFAEHGWRDVYLGFGVVILAIAPLLAWFTIGRPQDLGQRPDGVAADASATPGAAPRAAASAANDASNGASHDTSSRGADRAPESAAAALRDPNLWRIAFITGVGFMVSGVVVTHVVAMATDIGIESLRASKLLSTIAMGALLGKVVFGYLADRFGERIAYTISIAIELGALAVLTFRPSEATIEGVVAVLGLGIGGNLPLSSALLARAFGPAAFGRLAGLKVLVMTPIVATGTPFAGWIFDTTGSYQIAFTVFLGLIALSLVVLWGVRLPERPAGVPSAAVAG